MLDTVALQYFIQILLSSSMVCNTDFDSENYLQNCGMIALIKTLKKKTLLLVSGQFHPSEWVHLNW